MNFSNISKLKLKVSANRIDKTIAAEEKGSRKFKRYATAIGINLR